MRRMMLAVFLLALMMPARADLHSAQVAYKNGDFKAAFEEYRELAELGQPTAQHNLAVMYARGEGVPRNNTFAYAWASLAAENGHVKARAVMGELRSLLSPGSLKIADEIREEFGPAALEQRLMPKVPEVATLEGYEPCRMGKAAPVSYPVKAEIRGIQGRVYVEAVVMPDGRARHARILLAVPPEEFDATVRAYLRRSAFAPARRHGKAVPCAFGMYFRFEVEGTARSEYPKLENLVRDTQAKAESGDSNAQALYGVLISGLPQLNKETTEAIPWFLKAAQAGHPFAQFQLGSRLMKGWGCKCEENKGLVWLGKAAAAGQADAQVSLAAYALRGAASDDNLERARAWLERAVEQGHRDGKVYLSALLSAAPSEKIRDPDRALVLLKEVFRDVDDDPIAFEIRAAAYAALGQYADAVKDQSRATSMARKLGWAVGPQEERLARYRSNQPWHGDLLGMAETVERLQ